MNNNKTEGTAARNGREIKFRYRIGYVRGCDGKEVEETLIISVEDLEDGVFGRIAGTDIKIHSRDQFTGLHDKNGVEIYEGDIIEYIIRMALMKDDEPATEHHIVKMVVNRGYSGWNARFRWPYLDDIRGSVNPPLGQYDRGCQVIGNRFDNPELLEETN